MTSTVVQSLRREAHDLIWVILGKAALIGANAALMLMLARRLDLKTYGLLVTVISAQLLISRVLLVGVDRGIMRLRTVAELQVSPHSIVQAGLAVIAYTSLVSVLACVTTGLILFLSGSTTLVLATVVSATIGALGTTLVDYSYAFYLSHLQFRAASMVQSISATGRFILTISVALVYPHRPSMIFLSYAGASLAFGILNLALAMRGVGFRRDHRLMAKMVRYTLWPCSTNIVVILGVYEGTFLITALHQQEASGLFGLALTLSMGFFAVYQAYFEYLLPKVAHIPSRRELPRFLLRAYFLALLFIFVGIPAGWFIGRFVPDLLQPGLHGVVPIFYTLSISMILLMLQTPLEVTVHYLLRPHLITAGWTVRVITMALLGLAFVPATGAQGMAWAQVGGGIAGLLAIGVMGVVSLASGAKTDYHFLDVSS